jgi:hypothetical protein
MRGAGSGLFKQTLGSRDSEWDSFTIVQQFWEEVITAEAKRTQKRI